MSAARRTPRRPRTGVRAAAQRPRTGVRAAAQRPRTGAHAAAQRPRAGAHAAAQRPPRAIGAVVVTVSDTRRGADDTSGALAERRLVRAGAVVTRAWVPDEVAAIRRAVRAALARRTVDLVLLTGGTGVAPRDVTPEAVEPLLDRPLPGFGERFRALSERTVGSAAWLSRAGAGVARGRLVVYLPGSTGAVRQALDELLVPELGHLVRLLSRT